MSETVIVDKDGTRYSFDNIKTQGWLEGHSSGLDAAVLWLKERAVLLFRDGKDEDATRMRKLADEMQRELRPKMEARAKQHKVDYPYIVEET